MQISHTSVILSETIGQKSVRIAACTPATSRLETSGPDYGVDALIQQLAASG
jgi:hypothetical protein